MEEEFAYNTSLQDPSREREQSCRRGLAVFLAIPATLMLLFSLWALNLRLTIFSPSFLKGIPVRNELYERLPEMIWGIMSDQESYDQETLEEFKNTIGLEPINEFVNALIPSAWVQTQVENNIDLFFNWLDGGSLYPQLDFHYGEINERIRTDQVRNALRNLFSNLPPCETERDFHWRDFPHCQPPEEIMGDIIDDSIQGLLESFPEDQPPQDILDETSLDPELMYYLEIPQRGYRIFINSAWILWVITLVLWASILLIAARDVESALRWIGWPFSVVGVSSALLIILILVVSPSQITRWFAELGQDTAVNPYTLDLLSSLTRAFVRDVLEGWLFASGALSFFGICSLILAIWQRRLKGE
jgi:hypothetical protein